MIDFLSIDTQNCPRCACASVCLFIPICVYYFVFICTPFCSPTLENEEHKYMLDTYKNVYLFFQALVLLWEEFCDLVFARQKPKINTLCP